MSNSRAICRLSRRLAVAIANRSTRVIRQRIYKSRIGVIRQKAHSVAFELSKSFEGRLFEKDVDLPIFGKDIEDAARRIERGSFVLFGDWLEVSEAVEGSSRQWNTDFLTGVTFSSASYTDIRPKTDVADIKVPWEYGRFHYLLPLAAAYKMTKQIVHLNVYRAKVKSFHDSNPLGEGVQWVCTMEVGIRIFNLLASYELIHDAISADDELHVLIAEMAICHGEHIWANLETSARLQENNHYIADLLGLAAIASYYPTAPKAPKWRSYACRELMRCARKQILDDGCCFERSSRYTRLVGEMLYFAGKVLAGTPHALSAEYFERLSLLGGFLDAMTIGIGRSLQFGDNDSGRVVCISPDAYDDLRLVGRLVARERGLNVTSALFPEEELLYGAAAREEKVLSYNDGVEVFPDAGVALAFLHGWALGFYASDGFRGGAEAGHTHNDKLSFTLDVDGVSFFVDPGSGTYTRDTGLRNELRGTSQHSTLWFDNLEQNEFAALFGYKRRGGASLAIKERSNCEVLIEGSTDCWLSRVGVIHKREVSVDFHRVRVFDSLGCSVPTRYATRSFVLSPSVSITRLTDKSVVLRNGDVSVLFESNACISLREGLYSTRYGSVERTTIIDTQFIAGDVNSVSIGRCQNDD